jgi:hypothetical protein
MIDDYFLFSVVRQKLRIGMLKNRVFGLAFFVVTAAFFSGVFAQGVYQTSFANVDVFLSQGGFNIWEQTQQLKRGDIFEEDIKTFVRQIFDEAASEMLAKSEPATVFDFLGACFGPSAFQGNPSQESDQSKNWPLCSKSDGLTTLVPKLVDAISSFLLQSAEQGAAPIVALRVLSFKMVGGCGYQVNCADLSQINQLNENFLKKAHSLDSSYESFDGFMVDSESERTDDDSTFDDFQIGGSGSFLSGFFDEAGAQLRRIGRLLPFILL